MGLRVVGGDMSTEDGTDGLPKGGGFTLGLIIGLAVGATMWFVLDDVVLGLAIGIAVGVVLGGAFERSVREPR
jgi:hypothetical protein